MKTIQTSTLFAWFIFFCIGIALFFHPDAKYFLIGYYTLVFICITFFKQLKQHDFLFIVASLFTIAGFLAIERVFPTENKQFPEQNNYYIGQVEKQLNEGEDWSTNLIKLLKYSTDKGTAWNKTREKIVLITENDGLTVQEKDIILFNTKLKQIERNHNPGEFNAKMYWISKGVRYQGFGTKDQLTILQEGELSWFTKSLNRSRDYSTALLNQYVGSKDAPLIRAILLGDKSDLDITTKQIFTNTGAMHMLAVSGMHVGLIVVLLLGIFKWLFAFRVKRIALVLTILILWYYAFLTGFSASVVRAVVMFTILILSQFLKRGYHPLNSLAIAGFFILIYDPLSFFDIGFQLSFLAMVGIFTVFPLIEHAFTFKNKILQTAWQGTAIGLAAQVFTTPISIYYFHQFPNYFILTNFGVMLFSGIMLGLAIGLLIVGKIPFISIPVGWFLALCCTCLVGYIAFIEQIPGAVAIGFSPSWIWVALAYIVALLFLKLLETRKWALILLWTTPLIFWLQVARYKNISKEEWIIFNSNYPTILINGRNEKVCFYGGDEKGRKQAERICYDYLKLHPGKIEFEPIQSGKRHKIIVGKSEFVIQQKFGWISIHENNTHYAYITFEKIIKEIFDAKTKIICAANQTASNTFFTVKNEPFRKALR